MSNSFKISKQESLKIGISIRKRFVEQINRVIRIKNEGRFKHSYIYSPPGIGKSYTIEKLLNDTQVKYVKIKGNVSMYAFGVQLAVINHLNPNKEKIVIFVFFSKAALNSLSLEDLRSC